MFCFLLSIYHAGLPPSPWTAVILPHEAAVGIGGADHIDICKFDDSWSRKYSLVENAMAEVAGYGIIKEAAQEPKSHRCET